MASLGNIIGVMKLALFMITLVVSICNSSGSNAGNKETNFANGRSVIVHLFEWKFTDVAKECEQFLGPRGFGGVQLSPINENLIIPNRPWYERYQPISYKIISRSGDENQFREMVAKCNKAGVRIYVDVVFNHMCATVENPVGIGGSRAEPGKKSYPDAGYSEEHFHPTCEIKNYQNVTEVRNCELWGLRDLDQSNTHVQTTIVEYINKLIDIGVAGVRIDAAKHMWPNDLKGIYSRLKNLNTKFFRLGSQPLVYQEVIDLGGEPIKGSEYTDFGLVTDFKYGRELSSVFGGTNQLRWLRNWGTAWDLLPSADSLVFIDNHDNQRGHGGGGTILSHKQPKLYKMANAFMLAWPHGQPQIMSSYYFSDPSVGPPHNTDYSTKDVLFKPDLTCGNGWVCEHRWRQIYNMVNFRNVVEGTKVDKWWDNGSNQIAFCRGDKGFIAFNKDPYPLVAVLQTCMPPGFYCDIITGNIENGACTGKLVLVNEQGYANIWLSEHEYEGMMAIDKSSQLWGP